MKKIMKSIFAFMLFTVSSTSAQNGNVGIGTNSPASSAALDITSSNKALLLPRAANITAVTTPINGMIIYDILNNCIRAYENNAWSNCMNGRVAFGTVTSVTGRVWMDRNLGATRVATSVTDHLAYGDLYQWGRKTDGHEKITWTNIYSGTPVNGTTSTNADTPADALFITESNFPNDWRVNQNNDLWNGVNAVNNPCPAGFRIPTIAEITDEINAYNITNAATAFSSPFKFTSPGVRNIDGALYEGTGVYWSSSVNGADSTNYSFYPNDTYIYSSYRATGFSVRCLKD